MKFRLSVGFDCVGRTVAATLLQHLKYFSMQTLKVSTLYNKLVGRDTLYPIVYQLPREWKKNTLKKYFWYNFMAFMATDVPVKTARPMIRDYFFTFYFQSFKHM